MTWHTYATLFQNLVLKKPTNYGIEEPELVIVSHNYGIVSQKYSIYSVNKIPELGKNKPELSNGIAITLG
jgi:hypothetical protein